jgi:hypothetical protein
VIVRPIHALDPFAGGLAAVCRAKVTLTSDVSKEAKDVTCMTCRERLSCPSCGWPIPISSAAAMAGGRRYHLACAAKLNLEAPAPRR